MLHTSRAQNTQKNLPLLTSNVTNHHQGLKHKLRVGTFLIILLISRHLKVTGYYFPSDVHILCIQYDTVLANTAVLCMHVHIFC